MREELETYYQIDRYLNKELRGEELVSFEKRIKEDHSLAAEIEHQKLVNSVVLGAQFDSLRTKMQSDIAALDQGKTNFKWWIGGIAGVLLIGGGIFALRTNDLKAPVKHSATEAVQEPEEKSGPLISEEYPAPVPQKKGTPSSTKQPSLSAEDAAAVTSPDVSVTEEADQLPLSDAKDLTPAVNPFYDVPAENPLKINCNEVHITASPVVQSTCKGSNEGSIIVYPDKIKGGTAPYKIAVDENSTLQNKEVFSGLDAGKHFITIKDKSGCISTQEIVIPEKNCQKLNKFAFQPDLGETWKVPVSETESGTFSIYSGSGMLVYKSTFAGQGEWPGTDMHGNLLNAGTYVYIVEYSNGTRENGQISINR